ncbi:TetR/AcrR family transcriptional regulator [Paeniglutamicibacter sp.]|uniref:TetR/AcrR family transcriptional regulator n=1 Tax=Paeniglutamicibacter sp. TaxID=1934391 RepID=UPI003989D84B
MLAKPMKIKGAWPMNTSRRNARGEATLRSILAESVGLLGRYGYAGTTISRITKVTGKPASSIYWFFPTKDELLAAALEGTYQSDVENLSAWPQYTSDLGLREQLVQILTPAFTSSETEGPVRLGIMVVLEGSSEGSMAREPFRRRRQRARKQIHEWWSTASKAFGGNQHDDIAERMVRLTIAFLDGHYISDVRCDDSPQAQRGELVAIALCHAFYDLLESSDVVNLPLKKETRIQPTEPLEAIDGEDKLLSSARSLVAERSYEGATLALIGERAGMQRSSIYWRYKGKDELIRDAVAEPFLRLAGTTLPSTRTDEGTLLVNLAKSIADGVAASMSSPDTVKAGLLLKLQRRDPLSLASEAIQRGLVAQEAEMEQWLEVAIADRPRVDPAILAWMLNVLKEGLMLGVAFGYVYDVELLEGACASMIGGVLDDLARDPAEPHMQ